MSDNKTMVADAFESYLDYGPYDQSELSDAEIENLRRSFFAGAMAFHGLTADLVLEIYNDAEKHQAILNEIREYLE